MSVQEATAAAIAPSSPAGTFSLCSFQKMAATCLASTAHGTATPCSFGRGFSILLSIQGILEPKQRDWVAPTLCSCI
ncbi:hypothetical protein K505DRAFT_34572 [Melanomma pulvis-pyrius CBS 109.77]|uniref:Uncharacterized protein n=1 Tax=Melanomma pulvis-pyrius CBS 109.77 TaxID=1314802 RepID=A0A6A6XC63_9PLEO|nr:hypothetical protein K505DRAFT_34572 [Melanomma pulvis-pyrius CBS 109.77]